MRVHAPKLICTTRVSNFQTFKLVLCMYNKLCLHAAILSYPRSNPLNFDREQWRTVKS